MSRIALSEPEVLPSYLRALHDGAAERDWSTRHCARAFAPAPELLEQYLTGFYYNWHSNTGAAAGLARLSPREKELVRLRIATLNSCQTCKAARLSANTVSEDEALSVDAYEAVDGYFARHRVKPGITGWAQVNGWRGETDSQEKIQARVEHDLYYIENWSVLLDLYILAMTPFALAKTENAY